MAANFVDDYVNTAFADCLLILKLMLLAFRAVAIKPLVLHQAFLLFVHLLLDDILSQDLIVELKRLFVNEFVIQTFAISRLHNVAFRVDAVLVTLARRMLLLGSELRLLLYGVDMMVYKALRW